MSGKGKYKQTLNLPKSSFPRHVKLAAREQEILFEWDQSDLFEEIADARKDAPLYMLHDGPPYANGHLHYGHVLNKVLKDLIVKYKTMAGHRAPYVPGWDTHGLPIELAVDRELGKKKRGMSKAEIRAACRDYALRFVDIQRTEFRRLGVFGDWDEPYLTLEHGYEAAIVRALASFARGGYLYRGKKPVYWCPRDRTALAEAEIEYQDHSSPSIYVRMPLRDFEAGELNSSLAGCRTAVVIWTTTPWTLPANLAVVLHPRFEYVAIPSTAADGDTEYLIVAKGRAEAFVKATGIAAAEADWIDISRDKLACLEGVRYQHPFIAKPRADADFRIWFAEYVTLEQGTGAVHTAPGHGAEDYQTGLAHGLAVYAPVDAAGRFTEDVPQWQGLSTTEANPKIVALLKDTGFLLSDPGDSVQHQYAHCWRCKRPIIYRATPQWFVSIDHNKLRQRALNEISLTQWIPPWGESRITGMIENRPDWCLSRQRVWGVPIVAFYCKGCGEAHADPETMEAVAEVFAESGADAWYTLPVEELAPRAPCQCGVSDWQRENDIVDVWFESGCSWLAMLDRGDDYQRIDLYLEGSDQHRGWFHSSLLVGIAVSGKAPYRSVITHGFVLDDTGRPLSKSEIERRRQKGEKVKYVSPEQVIGKHGAELLRLWVGSTEFRSDIPYSEAILSDLQKWHRKLRNTFWFLLGGLSDFEPMKFGLDSVALTELDRYALARLGDLAARVRASYEQFEFHTVHRAIVDYVSTELSALYADVVKDRLYSESVESRSRRAAQAVLYAITRTLTTLLAPILCFSMEDVWRHLPKRDGDPTSVHLAELPAGKRIDDTDPLIARWTTALRYRELAVAQLEAFRAQGHATLQAAVTLAPLEADREHLMALADELADLFIVSEVTIADSNSDPATASVVAHTGTRCERCWKYFMTMSDGHDDLCNRCAAVIDSLGPRSE